MLCQQRVGERGNLGGVGPDEPTVHWAVGEYLAQHGAVGRHLAEIHDRRVLGPRGGAAVGLEVGEQHVVRQYRQAIDKTPHHSLADYAAQRDLGATLWPEQFRQIGMVEDSYGLGGQIGGFSLAQSVSRAGEPGLGSGGAALRGKLRQVLEQGVDQSATAETLSGIAERRGGGGDRAKLDAFRAARRERFGSRRLWRRQG